MSKVTTLSGRPFGEAPIRAVAIFTARGVRAGNAASGEWVRKTKLLLSQRGHGRVYDKIIRMRRGRPQIVRTKKHPDGVPRPSHQASAPGEVPARDEGNLVRSIGFEKIGPLTWRWGSGSIVALYMERGTRRIKPRPWMQRSLSAAGPAIRLALRRVLGSSP